MTSTPDHPPVHRPAPLTVAASLAAVEALVFVILSVAELLAFEAERAVMGATTALFFLVYGAGLGFCAWEVTRLKSWARAPIVVAQLLQLVVAWSFVGGETTLIAVALAVVALVVLVGVFHPSSLDALADSD